MSGVYLIVLILMGGQLTSFHARMPSMEACIEAMKATAAAIPSHARLACVPLNEQGEDS